MNRRDSLGLLLGVPFVNIARAMSPAREHAVVIYDGRFPEARVFASGAGVALDCREDAAILWYASGLGATRRANAAWGLTTAADALVIADCARRARFYFTRMGHEAAAASSHLVRWQISDARVRTTI